MEPRAPCRVIVYTGPDERQTNIMTQSNAQTEVRSNFNYTKDVDKLTELYF